MAMAHNRPTHRPQPASGDQPTIAATLHRLQQQGLPRLEAQMLVLHALGRSPRERAWLLVHDADPLSAGAAETLRTLAPRRLSGEPMAYLIGEVEFHGLPLRVNPQVLVPRPDTETLVDWAVDLIPPDAPVRVLDLGTGSGAVALAIAQPALGPA